MKTERTQIHFLTDVLIAVASLDLKVTKAHETKHVMSFPLFYFHVSAFSISWTPLSQSLEQAKIGSGFNLKTVISANSKYHKRKKLVMSPNFLLPL